MDEVAAIAQAVLYEGYLLWPYRRSALKNQHRFTIGGLYPREYAARSCDRSEAAFDVLVEGENPQLDLQIRFLHLVRRQVMRDGIAVDMTRVGDERYLTWEEAVERTVDSERILCEGGREEEPIAAGVVLVRSWERIAGRIERATQTLGPSLRRVSVRIVNESVTADRARDAALRVTLLAAHAALRVRQGTFVSPIDPPPEHAATVRQCRTEGLWPVLVGAPPTRDTVLASPIILEEYPQIAPEIPCDFFDGAEIGELLARSILALSDAEKQEIRATDPRARAILERVESMDSAALARLHGSLQSVSAPKEVTST